MSLVNVLTATNNINNCIYIQWQAAAAAIATVVWWWCLFWSNKLTCARMHSCLPFSVHLPNPSPFNPINVNHSQLKAFNTITAVCNNSNLWSSNMEKLSHLKVVKKGTNNKLQQDYLFSVWNNNNNNINCIVYNLQRL